MNESLIEIPTQNTAIEAEEGQIKKQEQGTKKRNKLEMGLQNNGLGNRKIKVNQKRKQAHLKISDLNKKSRNRTPEMKSNTQSKMLAISKQVNSSKNLNQRTQNKVTKELIEHEAAQTFSQVFQTKPKIEKKINQALEGWVIKKNHFATEGNCTLKQNNNRQLMDNFKINIQSNDHEQTVRPLSTRRSRNNQLATTHFLKQIKLKYAKAVRQSERQAKQWQKAIGKVNLIQAEVGSNNLQENNLNFQSFQNLSSTPRKTILHVKTLIPASRKSTSNIKMNIASTKYLSAPFQQELVERVNHDSLIPRPQSKSKSRILSKFIAFSNICNTSMEGNYNQKIVEVNNNLQKFGKHMTIDQSELESRRKMQASFESMTKSKKNHKIEYQRLKHKMTLERNECQQKSVLSQFLNQTRQFQQARQFQQTYLSSRHKKSPTKIKLKYLKYLKSHNNASHLSAISPRTLEKAKILQPKINAYQSSKLQFHKSHQKSSSSEANLNIVSWETRISSKGRQEFQKLKSLLKKQQSDGYIAYKEMPKQFATLTPRAR